MLQTTNTVSAARIDIDLRDNARTTTTSAMRCDIHLSIYDNLSTIEKAWRAFEQSADCTVFQSFSWLSTWQRYIGVHHDVSLAIVVGRNTDGEMVFLLPLAVASDGFVRRLTWLGSYLGDYNAPLLAADFSRQIGGAAFVQLWHEIVQRLQSRSNSQHDLIHFEKMPETVGTQPNPFLQLHSVLNPNNAYLTRLTDDWETFYAHKRSSTTRRRDRTKRKRMSDFGEVNFVSPDSPNEIVRSFDTLIDQKTQSFARMGIANMFERPGYPEFYRALATDPQTRELVQVSRLDVGATPAAVSFGLTFRNCYYNILASYDGGDLSKYGPGAAHLHELMRNAIASGCRVFDFTIGDERYKRDWCDTDLKLFDHVAFATWRGALVAVPLLVARRLRRLIKKTPILWNAFSQTRSVIGSLRMLWLSFWPGRQTSGGRPNQRLANGNK